MSSPACEVVAAIRLSRKGTLPEDDADDASVRPRDTACFENGPLNRRSAGPRLAVFAAIISVSREDPCLQSGLVPRRPRQKEDRSPSGDSGPQYRSFSDGDHGRVSAGRPSGLAAAEVWVTIGFVARGTAIGDGCKRGGKPFMATRPCESQHFGLCLPRTLYTSQPLRYSRLRKALAFSSLVIFMFGPSHSIFLRARMATHPKTTVSVSGPA